MIHWKLKEIVDKRGLHLREVARASGVSYTTIRKLYHNAGKQYRLSTLVKIADALGVRYEALVETIDEQ